MESNFNISEQDKVKMLKKLKRYKYGVFGIGVFACVLSVALLVLAIVISLEVVVYFIIAIMFGIGVAAIIEGVHYKVSLNLVDEEDTDKDNKKTQKKVESKNNKSKTNEAISSENLLENNNENKNNNNAESK